jgi:hypothetical protein
MPGNPMIRNDMSDFQKESDWWEGADGKWYPPVAKKTEVDHSSEPKVLAPITKKSNRKRIYLSGALALILLAVGVFVYQARKPKFGVMILVVELVDLKRDRSGWSVGADCDGTGCTCEVSYVYSDLNSGTQVIVTGKSGKEVARSALGRGSVYQIANGVWRNRVNQVGELDRRLGRKCGWFVTAQIPDNEDYYVLKIGERGEFKYSYGELTDFTKTRPFINLSIKDD